MVEMISEEEMRDLALLKGCSANVTKEFCKIALQTLQGQQIHPKIYISASHKLNVKATEVENVTLAILSVFLKCAEKKQDKSSVRSLLEPVFDSADCVEVLSEVYNTNKKLLIEESKKLAIKVPEYHSLEWRFDIIKQTRALKHISEPVISLQLKVKDERDELVPMQLQTDPSTLFHLTSTLEDALHKARSYHTKKLKKTKT